MEKINHLLPRPVFGMNAGVDHQADRAPDVGFYAAKVVVRILVETDILAQPLGVKSPAFGVSGVVAVFTKLRNVGQLLRDGYWEMMPGQPFVISDRFHRI